MFRCLYLVGRFGAGNSAELRGSLFTAEIVTVKTSYHNACVCKRRSRTTTTMLFPVLTGFRFEVDMLMVTDICYAVNAPCMFNTLGLHPQTSKTYLMLTFNSLGAGDCCRAQINLQLNVEPCNIFLLCAGPCLLPCLCCFYCLYCIGFLKSGDCLSS